MPFGKVPVLRRKATPPTIIIPPRYRARRETMDADIPAIQPIARAGAWPVEIPPAPLGGYTRKPNQDKMPPPDGRKRSIDNSYRRARKAARRKETAPAVQD